MAERFDVVVVGSGAGGGVVAGELADRGRNVLLLECGPHRTAADFTRSLSGLPVPADADLALGKKVFAETCAACHGEGGRGGLGTGAPSLVDEQWIYGGTRDDIMTTLQGGRQGVMPTWKARLEPTDIHLLALYVSRLNQTAAKEVTP